MRNKYPKQRISPIAFGELSLRPKLISYCYAKFPAKIHISYYQRYEITFSPKTNKRIHAELRTFGEKRQLIQ